MLRKLSSLPMQGKRILMRVDFNVPLDQNGNITDDARIKAVLPSMRYILDHGGSLVLMSHLGRPKGIKIPQLSLNPCARRLEELLGQPVIMASDCIGPNIEKLTRGLKAGQVVLLENLRFHAGEEHPEKDPSFVKQLASFGDTYVNDAFGTAHRAHASTATIAQYFQGKTAIGFLMEKEIEFLGNTLLKPKRPFYVILGGAKISTKLGVLNALVKKADKIFIGGGMAYTFYKAQGIEIGDSICENDLIPQAKTILQESQYKHLPFFLPRDNVIASELSNHAKTAVVESKKGIPKGFQGVDIGPKTVQEYVDQLKNAKTAFWNGPMGVFEIAEFSKGTVEIAKAFANLSATTIVGGGESVSAVTAAGLADKMSHISTGGGATLEYIEYGTLPGIEALEKNG